MVASDTESSDVIQLDHTVQLRPERRVSRYTKATVSEAAEDVRDTGLSAKQRNTQRLGVATQFYLPSATKRKVQQRQKRKAQSEATAKRKGSQNSDKKKQKKKQRKLSFNGDDSDLDGEDGDVDDKTKAKNALASAQLEQRLQHALFSELTEAPTSGPGHHNQDLASEPGLASPQLSGLHADNESESSAVPTDTLFTIDTAPDGKPFFNIDTIGSQSSKAAAAAWADDDSDDAQSALDPDETSGRSVLLADEQLPKAAWHDDDDDGEAVAFDELPNRRAFKLRRTHAEEGLQGRLLEKRLREEYERVHPMPSWAAVDTSAETDGMLLGAAEGASDTDSDCFVDQPSSRSAGHADATIDDGLFQIFRSTKRLAAVGQRGRMVTGEFRARRCRDIAVQMGKQRRIVSMQFHQSVPILLLTTAGRRVEMYEVDGRENRLIQKVDFAGRFKTTQAAFTPAGNEIIIAGQDKFFYSFDIESGEITTIPGLFGRPERTLTRFDLSPDGRYICFYGDRGSLLMVSVQSKQLVKTLKVNARPVATAWSSEGKQLYVLEPDARVTIWDIDTMRCAHTFVDHGGFHPSSLAVAGDLAGHVAIGSETGIVNIYDRASIQASQTPKPVKVVMSLTTRITQLMFSPSAKLLLLASAGSKGSLRLVHMPTLNIITQWPIASTLEGPLDKAAFSHDGRYLTFSLPSGRTRLYHLPLQA
ncbi:U3 snoRNP protein [Dimargaris verticillata]|uniref:U3 snoRNP protein n=1 Tax=Dimargaris verticillata TaxID=2761393 RepID=A0A9W8EAP0_9FUNG|nr:U3 snoRNP protein [Dimargaris verticillata]